MSEPRIDAIARSLTRRLPRRRVMGSLGGGLVAVAGLRALPKAAAVCQMAGTACDTDIDCCHGATCRSNRCTCSDGWEECEGVGLCVNRDEDAHHCGQCGNACAAGEACRAGECVDATRARDHCGARGTVCGETELCVLGLCLACPLGTVPCRNVCRPSGRCGEG